ncbi:hypothetical protein F8M41_012253 [Gigaspora margarita]|uniref:F-box domain-containing protein n=1 Tax=Gigaspora margarita TaxID=4874 RepID=A0A8H4EV20_GIGMA|nr:hypothetical protein F8M41_012253 [Gigaspora margarita]
MVPKIFMGDMPELMEIILNNLNNEIYSLHSCALVNRHWCKMSIPILWQNPFSLSRNPLFISKYFSSLDAYEKSVLKGYGITAEFPKTLFNYAKFLKVLDTISLEIKVREWISLGPYKSNSEKYSYHWYISDVYQHPYMYNIINLLFKLFVESGATLHKLDFYFSNYEINSEIFYSLEQNELFFSRLQHLSLSGVPCFNFENATKLSRFLAKNATKINALKLGQFYFDYDPELFSALICVIKSQVQLRKFTLISSEKFHDIISALECQKNSLQEVTLEYYAYNADFMVLTNCQNLKTLRMKYCEYMNLLRILNDKVNTLESVDCPIDGSNILLNLENLVLNLEKSGPLSRRLESDEILEESLLLKTLLSLCPNITYLSISFIALSTQLLEIINNLQKLQFLTLSSLWYTNDMREEELQIRFMKQFAESLPLKLQYLELTDSWLNSYIDILLNNCDAPLKKLLIHHLDNEKISKALIEFCIRNRSLNYVGLTSYYSLDNNIKKKVGNYVTLVPHERIVFNC